MMMMISFQYKRLMNDDVKREREREINLQTVFHYRDRIDFPRNGHLVKNNKLHYLDDHNFTSLIVNDHFPNPN